MPKILATSTSDGIEINEKILITQGTGTDVSDTTATAADVASGKYFYTADGIKTLGTATSSGSGNVSATVSGTNLILDGSTNVSNNNLNI